MAEADDVRRLALALPNVAEIKSEGFDFRVADRGFVWSYPERRPGKPRLIRTDIAVLFVGDEAEKQGEVLSVVATPSLKVGDRWGFDRILLLVFASWRRCMRVEVSNPPPAVWASIPGLVIGCCARPF